MRIVCLCNNWLGWRVLKWLKEQGEEIVALVMHPVDRCKYGDEIRSVVVGSDCVVLDGSRLKESKILEVIGSLGAEIGVSALFGYILRKEFLKLLPKGCVNLHPALLPYNRGAHPNVWSIVENTPAGATIHYIDEGVDTGDIIDQKPVPVTITDTGESLYRKLETASLELFRLTWPLIRSGACPRRPQVQGQGTFHRVRDVEAIDEIDLSRAYRAEDLLNVIRARTFAPYPGAYFRRDGHKIYLRLELVEEAGLAVSDRHDSEPQNR
jgi:methionyl-tRNA formyltransferase